NEQVGKLHQDITLMVDRVLGGMPQRVLNVVVGEVEIAPCMDADRAIDGGAHLFQLGGDDLGLEFEFVIGVRAGYDVGSPAFDRQPQHGDRFFQSLRAIIHTGKDVAVDIDQIQINISSSWVAWSTEARFPRARTEMAARTPETTPFTSRTGLRIVC